MRYFMSFVVVASLFAVVGVAQAAEQKQSAKPAQITEQKQCAEQKQPEEPWRYTFHNDEWWYWLPAGRWVYWRDNHWNNYDPKNYMYAACLWNGCDRSDRIVLWKRAFGGTDNRPFYGHAQSGLDRRHLEDHGEVGPFYGHALPNEVFGPWRSSQANRPMYGHAICTKAIDAVFMPFHANLRGD